MCIEHVQRTIAQITVLCVHAALCDVRAYVESANLDAFGYLSRDDAVQNTLFVHVLVICSQQ